MTGNKSLFVLLAIFFLTSCGRWTYLKKSYQVVFHENPTKIENVRAYTSIWSKLNSTRGSFLWGDWNENYTEPYFLTFEVIGKEHKLNGKELRIISICLISDRLGKISLLKKNQESLNRIFKKRRSSNQYRAEIVLPFGELLKHADDHTVRIKATFQILPLTKIYTTSETFKSKTVTNSDSVWGYIISRLLSV